MAKGKNDDTDPKKSAGDAKRGKDAKGRADDKPKGDKGETRAKTKGNDKGKGKDTEVKADDKGEDAKAKADDKGEDAKAKGDDSAKADDNGKGDTEGKGGDNGKADEAEAKTPEPKEEPKPAPKIAPRPAPPVPPKAGDSAGVELLPPRAIDTSIAPTTPAPAPGPAPAGDARSLRRGDEFCVIYRHKSHLIRREGKVGTTGEWTVTEYPNMAAAAHAYAQECSDLTGEGFTDIR